MGSLLLFNQIPAMSELKSCRSMSPRDPRDECNKCIDDYSPPQSPTQTLTSTDVSITRMNWLSIRSVLMKIRENSINY